MERDIDELSRKFYRYMAFEVGCLRAELATLADIVKHNLIETQDYDLLEFDRNYRTMLRQYRALFCPKPDDPRSDFEIVETDSENN